MYIPSEDDFRRWIKEAVQEYLEKAECKGKRPDASAEEPFLNRKEVAGMFRISLVTLNDWAKRGLPSHRQGGRIYFIRSEVVEYVTKNRGEHYVYGDDRASGSVGRSGSKRLPSDKK